MWSGTDDISYSTLQRGIANEGVKGAASAHLLRCSGELVLEDGACLQNNDTTAGGASAVDVRGGNVVLRTGSLIQNNNGQRAAIMTNAQDGRAGNIEMTGGAIKNNYCNNWYGAAVSTWCGSFEMSGGAIQNNYSTCGSNIGAGGVFVGGGEFTMSGDAEISYNRCGNSVCGGVHVASVFTMNGGTIAHNSTGSDGGGVFVGPSAKFTMNAGSITDNTSTRSGGGVANGNSTRVGGTFLMNGGIIGNNAVTGENFNKASGNLFTRIDTITVLAADSSVDGMMLCEGLSLQANRGAFKADTVFTLNTLPEPVRSGYSFQGWYTSSDLDESTKWDGATPAKGQIYYAKWEQSPYSIADTDKNITFGDLPAGAVPAERKVTVLHEGEGSILAVSCDSQAFTTSFAGMEVSLSPAAGLDAGVYTGTVTIITGDNAAHLIGVSVTITEKIPDPPPEPIVQDTGLALDQTTLELEPGDTAKLKASLTPADATYKYIFWESSDEAVATVSDSGLVTAVADGAATITAKSWYGNTATCEVTVKKADVPTPPEPTDPWPTEGLGGFVTRCYRVALSRDPDKAGHADWVRWLKDGTVDAATCTYGFVFSKEMNNKDLSDEDFVKTLYKLFMDREGEATGVAFWTEYLQAGHSREEVFYGFADSVEFARIKANYGIQ